MMKFIRFYLVAVVFAFFSGDSLAGGQEESGTVYAVQLLTSQKHLDASDKKFKGVNDVQEEVIDGLYKYTTGKVKNMSAAVELQTKMRNAGFTGAFVVRYKDGQRLTGNNIASTAHNIAKTEPQKVAAAEEVNKEPANAEPVKAELALAEVAKEEPVKEEPATEESANRETVSETKPAKKERLVIGSTMSYKEPEFKGGPDSLTSFIKKNLRYPKERILKVEDGQVLVSFTVDYRGKIKNAIIIGHVNKELDAEALRIIRMMPAWNPGTIEGSPSSMECLLPVNFAQPPQ